LLPKQVVSGLYPGDDLIRPHAVCQIVGADGEDDKAGWRQIERMVLKPPEKMLNAISNGSEF
jgi:hypothetical protein